MNLYGNAALTLGFKYYLYFNHSVIVTKRMVRACSQLETSARWNMVMTGGGVIGADGVQGPSGQSTNNTGQHPLLMLNLR